MNILPSLCLRTTSGAAALLIAAIAAGQTTRSVWDGVYTQAQAKRGEMLYAEQCASCHGLSLNGGESAPPLSGGEFLSNWNTLTVGDLFDRIRSTMPADRPGHLTRDQTADLVAHILAVNQFPPGSTELDHRSEYLKEIRIEAVKPEKR